VKGVNMHHQKKPTNNSKSTGVVIAVVAILIFVFAIYMGAGMQAA
jgi:hypothetical protein